MKRKERIDKFKEDCTKINKALKELEVIVEEKKRLIPDHLMKVIKTHEE